MDMARGYLTEKKFKDFRGYISTQGICKVYNIYLKPTNYAKKSKLFTSCTEDQSRKQIDWKYSLQKSQMNKNMHIIQEIRKMSNAHQNL